MLTTRNCFIAQGMYAGRDLLDYGIKEGDKVLDIGGGVHPFAYATHILDSLDEEFDKQRYGAKVDLEDHQTLIEGTTDDLVNFKDNEFDFIYTSHTLEHVVNLPKALEEISRVGNRGFVAVPHYLYDLWSVKEETGHKWFCDYRDDVLLIRERDQRDFVDYIAHEWEKVMWGEDWDKTEKWRRMWEGHFCIGTRIMWEIRFFWYDYIDYKVDPTMFYQLDLHREMVAQLIKDVEEGKVHLVEEVDEEKKNIDSDSSEEGVEESTT
jgi:predicted SAM-dependent methyltransferase